MKHIRTPADAEAALAKGSNPAHVVAALWLLVGLLGRAGHPDRLVVLLESPADLAGRADLLPNGELCHALGGALEHYPDLGCFAVCFAWGEPGGLCYVLPDALLSPELGAALARRLGYVPATRVAAP